MKLNKGYTYLVKINETVELKTFWIVAQNGQRSWIATRFSDMADFNYSTLFLTGNSIKIVELLEARLGIGEELEYVKFVKSDKVTYRKVMFNILRYGTLSEDL